MRTIIFVLIIFTLGALFPQPVNFVRGKIGV